MDTVPVVAAAVEVAKVKLLQLAVEVVKVKLLLLQLAAEVAVVLIPWQAAPSITAATWRRVYARRT
jgi:hypothetical protein